MIDTLEGILMPTWALLGSAIAIISVVIVFQLTIYIKALKERIVVCEDIVFKKGMRNKVKLVKLKEVLGSDLE